jgi:plastocyanin
MEFTVPKLGLLVGSFIFLAATHAVAQNETHNRSDNNDKSARIAPIVALDECDPSSFNAVLGPDFCKNVSIGILGYTTTFQDLFARAAAGTPDPGWDFEPDTLTIKEGTTLVVTDQGGEPHTFTEVKKFGGGFIDGLNAGEQMVNECSGGFSNVAVAKTRIIQGSQMEVTNLSKGKHHFECCIHPWMRVTVEVK